MSPESALHPSGILEESLRIAAELLDVERTVSEYARPFRDQRIMGIRGRLGYTAMPNIESDDLVDSRITFKNPLITPEDLSDALPLSQGSADTTRKGRRAVEGILNHEDDRLIVIVGPCSIHDPAATLEYAQNVSNWRKEYGSNLEILMRFYPEKPRTELGWKGFIIDPSLNGSNDINHGIVATRFLALRVTGLGVPIAMERLNALTPQYVNGLVAYDAIGARNTTDQKAREYGSGTSSPVGFKNTPEGSVLAALQAVVAARGSHSFPGFGMDGRARDVGTKGNPLAHIILRGDQNGPNYDSKNVENTVQLLLDRGLLPSILIDASHGNSGKQADRQISVVGDIAAQIAAGQSAISGVMIESNLVAGHQEPDLPDKLIYGKSVTDECVGLDATTHMLNNLSQAVDVRRLDAAN